MGHGRAKYRNTAIKISRFVILTHDHPFLHWDFLFEAGSSLESWRLLDQPILNRWLRAERLPDHRTIYLDYEGPVSGNRGLVQQYTCGEFCPDETEHGRLRRMRIVSGGFAEFAEFRIDPQHQHQWRFE